jgi:hypothetical protein
MTAAIYDGIEPESKTEKHSVNLLDFEFGFGRVMGSSAPIDEFLLLFSSEAKANFGW